MVIISGKTTFDGVLRLEIVPSSELHTLQAQIKERMPDQIPVVDRYLHLTLAGISHLKPYKNILKSTVFPEYPRSVDFEDTPRIAQTENAKSTFIYATASTQQQLFSYVNGILTPLNIPLENDRKFHLSLTNLTGFGPNNVGPVWLHESPIKLANEKAVDWVNLFLST